MGRGWGGGVKTPSDILLKMVLDFPDQLTQRSLNSSPLSPCLDQGGLRMKLMAAHISHIYHQHRDFCFAPAKTPFVLSYKRQTSCEHELARTELKKKKKTSGTIQMRLEDNSLLCLRDKV